jgi:DNA polymerase III epsilon subunit-like protein
MKMIVFDFETTGLTLHPDAPLERQPRAIEFGAALIEGTEILRTINLMINPGEPISAEITKITGITDDDVRDAPGFSDVLPQIADIFGQADCAVAHNLPFDRAILRYELARLQCGVFPWPAKELCTVGINKEFWGKNPRLIELFEEVAGRPYAQTHRALDDVMALVEIVQIQKLWEVA